MEHFSKELQEYSEPIVTAAYFAHQDNNLVFWALLQRIHDGTAYITRASGDCDCNHIDSGGGRRPKNGSR